eukprot:Skav200413  [mRNA]  locus=scaffold3090:38055:38705:- [translate_table: standard]
MGPRRERLLRGHVAISLCFGALVAWLVCDFLFEVRHFETFCQFPSAVCSRFERVALHATGSPVATAPPPVIPTASSEPIWTECFLTQSQVQDSAQSGSEVEVWLFRSDTASGFEKFLQHRHFDPGKEKATCRSISPDSSIQCLECTRVIFGGVYGSIGVVVPAYPHEGQAVGCLSRNRVVEADFEDDDNYDGNPTCEVALCNSHRGRFDSALPFHS